MSGRPQRSRTRWSAIVAAASLVVLAPIAYLAYRQQAASAEADTLARAEERISEGLRFRFTSSEIEPPANTWLVNPVDGWSDPTGDTWTNPPLISIGADALDQGETVQEYDFNGSWLGHGVWIGDNNVLVTVVERETELAAIAGLRLRWLAITVAASAAAGLIAFAGLGRAQAPVRRAHAVNRDFIADAAHELRTPLSIIQASAGFALARERSDDEYRESLGEILHASERAAASVGELLEFARLEAGQASLRLAPLRLDLLVEEVAASIRVEGVTVEPLAGEAVVVEADYNLVRQAIDNIGRNAAARADKVTLATRLDPDHAVIEVADDGPGFDPGVIDHVFERFRRGDRSGSVGLGMAIARTVVELHGGSCEASNRPPDQGGGALVTIRLPHKPSRSAPA